MKLLNIKKNTRSIKRLEEIIRTLSKFGFGYLIEETDLKNRIPFMKRFHKQDSNASDITVYERARLVLEELGATFIKIGQVLSSREDLVGKHFAKEFSKLQDAAPPIPFHVVRKQISLELGASTKTLFTHFEREPLASASIGQVHKATLKNGTVVVIKVQRLDISRQIEDDIRIMRQLVALISRHVQDLEQYGLPQIIDEFERSIKKELDYRQEKQNINRFALLFAEDENVVVPQTFDEYCTRRILTMQYIDGIKISELPRSSKVYDKKLIAKRGVQSVFKQILIDGFFHADPHPGNLFVLKDNKICFIDFGMMGRLDKEFVDNLSRLFIFLIDYDVNNIIHQLLNMGLIDEQVDMKSFKYDLMDIMDLYYGSQLQEIDLGNMLRELTLLLGKYKVTLPRELVLLSRALIIIESVGKDLDPEFNIVEACKPLAEQVVKQRVSLDKIPEFIKQNLFEIEHFIRILPKS